VAEYHTSKSPIDISMIIKFISVKEVDNTGPRKLSYCLKNENYKRKKKFYNIGPRTVGKIC
jgi:hypothetical protein